MKYFILISTLLLFSSCHSDDNDCHKDLFFENNSSETIWYGLSRGDTDLFVCRIVTTPILSNESSNYNFLRSCWEDDINGGYNGSLAVYYFSEQPYLSLDECNEEELNQLVIQRKEFTIDDLNALNWRISYQ